MVERIPKMSGKRKSSAMGNETNSEIPSSSGRFPVESENPFESPFNGFDVILTVEGKKLYVDKKTLSLHSPVFQTMFQAGFKETDAKEVEIKDTQYNAMVKFLRLMYPLKSFKFDDGILEDILLLADFYHVDFIRRKCEDYIGQQLQQPDKITYDRNMFLLLMCKRFSLKHLNALLDLTSKRPIRTEEQLFESLKSDTQMELLKRRCRFLEEENARNNSMITEVKRGFEIFNPCRGSCGKCDMELKFKTGVCMDCIRKTLHPPLV